MENLDTVFDKVHDILVTYPETRNSDKKLIVEYFRANGVDVSAPFGDVMLNETPSMESITRSRRRVQAKYPELAADGAAKAFRADREEEFYTTMKDNGVL